MSLPSPGRIPAFGAWVPREPTSPRKSGIFALPSTKLGWLSVWLMVAAVIMFVVNATVFMPSVVEIPWRTAILPFYAIAMVACGLAAGVGGMVAIVRKHERSWLVWLPVFLGADVILFVVGELDVPH